MLQRLLTPETVQIIDTATDWRDAVQRACQPLLDNNAIEPSYVEAIFRAHESIGPFYVLGPGLAMPHARPEDGVNRLSLSLTSVRQGVNFNSAGNDPVHLLFVLAATDSNSHVEIISQLAALFDHPDDTAALIAADSVEHLLSTLSRY